MLTGLLSHLLSLCFTLDYPLGFEFTLSYQAGRYLLSISKLVLSFYHKIPLSLIASKLQELRKLLISREKYCDMLYQQGE